MEIRDYYGQKDINREIWGYLFFSNDPQFIHNVMIRNKDFITFHDVDNKKILKGPINYIRGKIGYYETIKYNAFPIIVACSLYNNDQLVKKLNTYTQLKESVFTNESGEEIGLEMLFNGNKLRDIYTPDSIPYCYYHPENMRAIDREQEAKKNLEYDFIW